jgi:hypothetical protein
VSRLPRGAGSGVRELTTPARTTYEVDDADLNTSAAV